MSRIPLRVGKVPRRLIRAGHIHIHNHEHLTLTQDEITQEHPDSQKKKRMEYNSLHKCKNCRGLTQTLTYKNNRECNTCNTTNTTFQICKICNTISCPTCQQSTVTTSDKPIQIYNTKDIEKILKTNLRKQHSIDYNKIEREVGNIIFQATGKTFNPHEKHDTNIEIESQYSMITKKKGQEVITYIKKNNKQTGRHESNNQQQVQYKSNTLPYRILQIHHHRSHEKYNRNLNQNELKELFTAVHSKHNCL